MKITDMSPRRPYLLRAFYDWLLDNQLTPHLLVDVTMPGVMVPMEFARDGQIVLNVAPRAVGNLELGNNDVCFNARFSGVPHDVFVPIAAILAIYARENGAGTTLESEPAYEVESFFEGDLSADESTKPIMSVIDGDLPDVAEKDTNDTPPTPPRGGRPILSVVK